jgi:hypothetical protein
LSVLRKELVLHSDSSKVDVDVERAQSAAVSAVTAVAVAGLHLHHVRAPWHELPYVRLSAPPSGTTSWLGMEWDDRDYGDGWDISRSGIVWSWIARSGIVRRGIARSIIMVMGFAMFMVVVVMVVVMAHRILKLVAWDIVNILRTASTRVEPSVGDLEHHLLVTGGVFTGRSRNVRVPAARMYYPSSRPWSWTRPWASSNDLSDFNLPDWRRRWRWIGTLGDPVTTHSGTPALVDIGGVVSMDYSLQSRSKIRVLGWRKVVASCPASTALRRSRAIRAGGGGGNILEEGIMGSGERHLGWTGSEPDSYRAELLRGNGCLESEWSRSRDVLVGLLFCVTSWVLFSCQWIGALSRTTAVTAYSGL